MTKEIIEFNRQTEDVRDELGIEPIKEHKCAECAKIFYDEGQLRHHYSKIHVNL